MVIVSTSRLFLTLSKAVPQPNTAYSMYPLEGKTRLWCFRLKTTNGSCSFQHWEVLFDSESPSGAANYYRLIISQFFTGTTVHFVHLHELIQCSTLLDIIMLQLVGQGLIFLPRDHALFCHAQSSMLVKRSETQSRLWTDWLTQLHVSWHSLSNIDYRCILSAEQNRRWNK